MTDAAARFSAWVALTAFSAMCLAAHENTNVRERIFFQDENEPSKAKENWVTAVTSISTAFGFLSIVAYIVAKKHYVGTRIELAAALLNICIWSAGLPVITGPTNHIAAGLTIIDYNLYFFSWAAFDANLYVLGSFFHSTFKVQMWSYLTLCSIIVMGSSTRLFGNSTCRDSSEDIAIDCTRIKWAIALGVFCGVACLLVTVLTSRNKIGLHAEIGIAVIVLIMYAFGIGYITFGNGPGSLILGNLYFFTWLGFIAVLILTSQTIYDAVHGEDDEDEDEESILAQKSQMEAEKNESTLTPANDAEADPEGGEKSPGICK